MGRTAPLTSKRYILYIYSTNTGTEYFKHALYSLFFSLQNAVCFIMLTCLVTVLFTFYIQDVLKLKKNNSGAKGLNMWLCFRRICLPDDKGRTKRHNTVFWTNPKQCNSTIYSFVSVDCQTSFTCYSTVASSLCFCLWARTANGDNLRGRTVDLRRQRSCRRQSRNNLAT